MTVATSVGVATFAFKNNFLEKIWSYFNLNQEKRDRQSIEDFVRESTDVKVTLEDFTNKYSDPTTLQGALDRVPFGLVKTYSSRLKMVSIDVRTAVTEFQKVLDYVIVTTGRQARFETSFESGSQTATKANAAVDSGSPNFDNYAPAGANNNRTNSARRKLTFNSEEELVEAFWEELFRYFPDEKKFAVREVNAMQVDEVTGKYIKDQCRSNRLPFRDFWVMGLANERFFTS